jgi:hypothetical protein
MSFRQVTPHERFPSGERRAILQFAVDLDRVEEVTGLRLNEQFEDQLGTFTFAAIELPNREQVWIGRAEGDIAGRLLVFTDQGANLTETQDLLVEALHLRAEAVFWRLTIDVDHVTGRFAQVIGATEIVAGGDVPAAGPVMMVDRNLRTVSLTDPRDPTWLLTIEAGQPFVAKLEGVPAPAAIHALAWLDFDVGLRLQTEPASLRELLEAEQAAMWPRWAEWRKRRRV